MAKFSRGFTFVDGGGPYNSANLHALFESGTILPGFISDWSAATPVAADTFLFYAAAAGTFKYSTLTNLIAAFPGDAAAGTKSLRSLGTGATQASPGNDSRFPSSINGIRTGHVGSPDTVAVAQDYWLPSHNLAGSLNVDWSAAELYYDTLTGSGTRTYTFSNNGNGGVITIMFKTSTFSGTINWPTLIGTVPAFQPGATASVYTFLQTAPGIVGIVKNL